jgi:hypothetical protein
MMLILQFSSPLILEELNLIKSNLYRLDYKKLLGTKSLNIINREWINKYLGLDIDCIWEVEINTKELVQIKLDKVLNQELLLKNLESRLKESIKVFIETRQSVEIL